jgi:hypothetical protein
VPLPTSVPRTAELYRWAAVVTLTASFSGAGVAALLNARRARARYAAVVRAHVVLTARCAGVVRMPVMRSARRAQPDHVRAVIQISARCAACGAVRRVIQSTGSSCRAVCSCH